jgi:hypothetical protein
MKNFFPSKNQTVPFMQTNRSDDLGSLWSSFNLDFQSNLGVIRLAQKLVINAQGTGITPLGCSSAFEYFDGKWWAIGGTRLYSNFSPDITSGFLSSTIQYNVGDSTTRFDITFISGSTYRYTYDLTGTNPDISATTFPIGASVTIDAQNFTAGNKGTFTVTGSGANYFEVTNAGGSAENDKTIGTGYISVFGGTIGTNYSTVSSDFALFNNRLWATTRTQLYSKAIGANHFMKRDDLNDTPHPMVYFSLMNRLYYADTRTTIKSIGDNDVVADSGTYFIELTKNYGDITCMTSTSQYIWIGMVRNDNSTVVYGSVGYVLQWDGFSSKIINEYPIDTAGVLSIITHNSVPYAIDTEGRILKYTGYSFEEIQRLPINRTLLKNATGAFADITKPIHFNGMTATKNNTLLISVNNLNDNVQNNISEKIPSGIWELDLNTLNFTHRYSFTLKSQNSDFISDFGQNRVRDVGAIKINTLSADNTTGRGTLLAGASFYSNATESASGIFIDSPIDKTSTGTEGQKRGYFVTTFFNSQEIEDKWTRLWDVHKRFETSTDKIVYKYRLTEQTPIEANITWTSTTTFTTTTNITAYAPTATGFNGTTGGEVEFIQGTGSGACVHITNVVNNSGTYTVTIDNAVIGVSGTAKARFQKWIKMFPEVTGMVKSWQQMAIGANNSQIQIKCYMEFTGDMEFQKLAIFSNEDIKVSE